MTRGKTALLFSWLVAFAAIAATAAPATAAQDAIKIGVLLIDSGPLAALKETQVKAVDLAIEEINANGGVLGKKFEADYVTYSGAPDSAIDAATRAVEKDGATFITGMLTSAVSPAIAVKAPSLGAIVIEVFARADAMTGARCSSNYFRVTESDSMVMAAINRFVGGSGVKSWDTISVDYNLGRDSTAKFRALVQSQGAVAERSIFTPMGTSDYGAKISELGDHPAEGLYVTVIGGDAINFAKQQAQFGLFKKYKMVLGNSFVIPQTLAGQRDSVLGVYETLGFTPTFPTAKAFVQAYARRYNGETPAFTSADQYIGVQLAAEAIRKAGSTEVDKIRAAMAGIKLATPLGEIEVRAGDHQSIRPVAITRLVPGENGKPDFEVESIEPGASIIPPVNPACKL